MTAQETPRLVVGVDGSPDSDRAVRWATLHARALRGRVVLLHGSAPVLSSDATDELLTELAEHARQAVRRAQEVAAAAPDADVTTEEVATGGPQALIGASDQAWAVVVGARGHGRVGGALVGSVSQHVARHAAGPVVVVREPADRASRTIVVGVDGERTADPAVELALALAEALSAPVLALRAWQPPGWVAAPAPVLMPELGSRSRAEQVRALEHRLAPARERHPSVVVTADVVPGHPQRVLADASQHAALLVVGARGLGGFRGLLLGSVSQSVLQHAACPVAVVR